jgi:hypothetical protein
LPNLPPSRDPEDFGAHPQSDHDAQLCRRLFELTDHGDAGHLAVDVSLSGRRDQPPRHDLAAKPTRPALEFRGTEPVSVRISSRSVRETTHGGRNS